jgi:hypothetical protein
VEKLYRLVTATLSMSGTAWWFEFYQIGPDGTRAGGHKIADASESVAIDMARVQSIMRDRTFTFGKANPCLIKTQQGRVICEVGNDA